MLQHDNNRSGIIRDLDRAHEVPQVPAVRQNSRGCVLPGGEAHVLEAQPLSGDLRLGRGDAEPALARSRQTGLTLDAFKILYSRVFAMHTDFRFISFWCILYRLCCYLF